jgi:vacuolar-type H+-ATPase subunit I/STV1
MGPSAYRLDKVPTIYHVSGNATWRLMRFLIILGAALILIGLIWPYLNRLGLGHLPGDIVIEGESRTLYFPIVTCLIVSVLLSLVFWVIGRLSPD